MAVIPEPQTEPRVDRPAAPLPGLAREPVRPAPVIQQGVCYALFAYDVARSIDLGAAERLIATATQREALRDKRRAPQSFRYSPPPLRVTQAAEPLTCGDFQTERSVDAVLYDFGAVSVTYAIPLRGSLDDLLALSDVLYDNERLLDDSRRRVEALLHTMQPAVTKPGIHDYVEDYAIFHIAAVQPHCGVDELLATHAQKLAQILRGETTPLSGQEVGDALSGRISFGTRDATILDWNATLVLDSDADDVRTVLEFANVELLEMRYLDRQLDGALEQAYRVLSRQTWPGFRVRSFGADLRRVARLQADAAVLFEGVNNALKLVGEQYLARIYRLASQRLHLFEWDGTILRKLQTLESIYSKMSDIQASRRMELLEWIIIVLIALSIALPFVPGFGKH